MSAADCGGVTVLLVEDIPADVFLVREAMREESLACELRVMDDGEKAIHFIDLVDAGSETAPSLLLLDLNVPRRTGDEVLQRVRRSPFCKAIHVVIITSSDSPEDRRRAKNLGADHYFRKPTNLDEFMQLGKLVRHLTTNGRNAAA